jgi:hypothetical protein
MRIFIFIALLLALSSPAVAQINRSQLSSDMSTKISDEQLELTNWMMFYYKKPAPNDFPDWIKKASAEGMFKDEAKQFPFLGFVATIFATNADKIPQWVKIIDTLPEQDRKTVLIALWLSGTKFSQDTLLVKSRQRLLNGQNYFNFQTDLKPPSLNDINVYWGFLDIQWGRFFASGSEEPIKNIISVLKFAQFMGARETYPQPKTDEENAACRLTPKADFSVRRHQKIPIAKN